MTDPCYKPGLLPFEQAQIELLEAAKRFVASNPRKVETIDIWDADNRVVGEQVVSPLNVPGHDNSAMDGFALHIDPNEPQQLEFEVIGAAFAGSPFKGEVKAGQAIKIMTGGKLPEGANTVEMKENVELLNDQLIRINKPVKLGSNIRRAGEDIAKDQTVFETGHTLTPADIGLLASLGNTKVNVFETAKVAIFSTGDELKAPGQPLEDGDIYESNRYVVISMLKRLGVEVLDLGIIPDSHEAIKAAFVEADEQADLVLSSGGVSVGEADYTKDVLDEIGEVGFWKIAMKPGKPLAFGSLPNSLFMGLPGNPVSATVTFYHLAKLIVDVLSNKKTDATNRFLATTTSDIRKRPGRRDFQRGIATIDADGQWHVSPLQKQGSGILSSISRANCFIDLPAENGGYNNGESVFIELFETFLK